MTAVGGCGVLDALTIETFNSEASLPSGKTQF